MAIEEGDFGEAGWICFRWIVEWKVSCFDNVETAEGKREEGEVTQRWISGVLDCKRDIFFQPRKSSFPKPMKSSVRTCVRRINGVDSSGASSYGCK